eukprot:Nk52_evm54s2657 gene=Nk52_evmTU54s2657
MAPPRSSSEVLIIVEDVAEAIDFGSSCALKKRKVEQQNYDPMSLEEAIDSEMAHHLDEVHHVHGFVEEYNAAYLEHYEYLLHHPSNEHHDHHLAVDSHQAYEQSYHDYYFNSL